VDLEYSEMGGYTTRLGCPVDSCWISADVSQLKQVLVNLARNAMEAMGPGGGAARSRTWSAQAPLSRMSAR
jgi:C4-dicarboxylate-specific signal transduction histidine kinase